MRGVTLRAALYALFLLSGAAGLGYQIVWTRLFANGLGHELPAMLAVVASFFAGLSAGGWLLDQVIARSGHPGRWYAGLELLIGIWGMISIVLIPFVNEQGPRLIGVDVTALRHWTFAFALPLITLLPATFAMGATWPAMEKFAAPLTKDHKVVGALYAANTCGAVLGVCVSTFGLLPRLGFTRTLLAFAGVNLGCAMIAAWLTKDSAHFASASAPGIPNCPRIPLRVIVFCTGLLGIGYEVVGVRVLSNVLENTIYTFASAVAIYLGGTAIGAALYQRFLRRGRSRQVGTWLLVTSLACVIGLFALSKVHLLYDALRSLLPHSVAGAIGAEAATAAIVFLVPTMVMGALFSHLVQSGRDEDGTVGRVTALNTLGSATAPMLFGILLIPAIGTGWALKAIALGYVVLAVPTMVRSQLFAIFLAVAAVFVAPSALQRTRPPVGGNVLDYREGIMDSVAVVQHADGNRSLVVNNRFTMGGTGAATAERRHAHIPLLLHPQPTRALFLGLGTGITFAASGAYPGLTAEGVELVPEITEVLPRFEPENSMPELDRRLKIYVADARRFIRASDRKYDVIVADLFHPARDGAGTLYTREHFQTIRDHLSAGGLFCQWLPLYQLDEPMLKVITKTFLEVFPNGTAWLLRPNIDTPVIGLIGGIGPNRYTASYFENRVRDGSQLVDRLNTAQLRNGFELFGCFLADGVELRAFAKSAEVNTDDHPLVVFGAPRLNYQASGPSHARLLALVKQFHSAPDSLLAPDSGNGAPVDVTFANELRQFTAARNLYLQGLADEADGRPAEALERFLESAGQSEHFTIAYARCLTLATQQMKDNPDAARAILERLDRAQPNRPVAQQLLNKLRNQ